MSIRHGALVSLALWWAVVGAQAQTAAPAKADAKADAKAEAKADPKADPKADEAAAAMERAKRMAAGPMRVILEASKGKQRREPEPAAPAPAPADAGSLRAVSARPAAAAAATDIAVRAVPAPQNTAAAEPTPQPAAAAPSPAPTATAVTTQITLSSDSLQSHKVAPVPGLERDHRAATVPALMPAAPAALPALPEANVKPTLLSRVDPELPQRLLDELGRNAVVSMDLTIRPDGQVARVAMVSNVSQRVQRLLVAALEQWRFNPLPSERVHRIELVFNGE